MLRLGLPKLAIPRPPLPLNFVCYSFFPYHNFSLEFLKQTFIEKIPLLVWVILVSIPILSQMIVNRFQKPVLQLLENLLTWLNVT